MSHQPSFKTCVGRNPHGHFVNDQGQINPYRFFCKEDAYKALIFLMNEDIEFRESYQKVLNEIKASELPHSEDEHTKKVRLDYEFNMFLMWKKKNQNHFYSLFTTNKLTCKH